MGKRQIFQCPNFVVRGGNIFEGGEVIFRKQKGVLLLTGHETGGEKAAKCFGAQN